MSPFAALEHGGKRGAGEPHDRRHHRVDLRLRRVGVELHEGHVGLVAGIVDEHRDVARARAPFDFRDAFARVERSATTISALAPAASSSRASSFSRSSRRAVMTRS